MQTDSWENIRRVETRFGIKNTVFPRGFIYSGDPLELPPELSHLAPIAVPNGQLYVETGRCSVTRAKSNRAELILLGRMTSLRPEPPTDLAQYLLGKYLNSPEDFHEELDWCGGRFVILVFCGEQVRFYHDFLATRSVYFHRSEGLVSSHYNLLAQFARNLTDRKGPLSGVNIYRWWDYTGSEEVNSLLANHYVELSNKAVTAKRYWPRTKNPHVGRSAQELCAEIRSLWQRSLQRLADTTNGVALSLTGGQDSRLMLSLAVGAIPGLKCFMYMPVEDRIKDANSFWATTYRRDHELVNQMAEMLSLDHEFLREPVADDTDSGLSVLTKLNRIGAGHGNWVVKTLLHHFAPDEYVHIRGNFLESTRAAIVVDQAQSELTSLLGIVDHHQKKAFGGYSELSAEDVERSAMEKLEEFGFFDLDSSWEKTTLFYCEARTSQWHAEIANEHDIVFDTYLPHNNRRIMELFWATRIQDRRDNLIVMDLINATVPVLNFFPVNGEDNLYDSWRRNLLEGSERTKLLNDWLPERDSHEVVGSTELNRVTLIFGAERKEMTLHDAGFHIPAAALAKSGRVETESFVVPQGADAVEFIVRLPYANPAGAGRISFEIEVNGAVREVLDPARSPERTLVRIAKLRAGDILRFVLTSTVHREAVSWRKASNTQLSELRFLKESPAELETGTRVRFQRKTPNLPVVQVSDVAELKP